MIRSCFVVIVKFFQIFNQVVDPLCVQKLEKMMSLHVYAVKPRIVLTFLITWDGSVLSIAFKYCCIAVS